MKLRQLEHALQQFVPVFRDPKIQLEQYPTPPHLAACMLYTAQTTYNDIQDKIILDLGCGCGMLSVAAVHCGAAHVFAVDVDADALAIASHTVEACDMEGYVDMVQSDVRHLQRCFRMKEAAVDTVIMNPPFGTKNNAGMDVMFLETALACVRPGGVVYSLHKSSTRAFFERKAKQWNVSMEVVAALRYNVEASYTFHKRASVDVEVDFLRFVKQE